MDVNYLQITSAIFVGLASGYLGSFMVLKRMALVGDALSHVALPGVALGIVFNFNPILGAFATLFAGIIGVWFIEHKTELPSESIVGLFFTVALAVGILIIPEEDVLEALFGDISQISFSLENVGTDTKYNFVFVGSLIPECSTLTLLIIGGSLMILLRR